MSDSGRSAASKTVANATLEELITPKLDPGRACLLVIRGRSVGQVLELAGPSAVIGRSLDADFTIDDVAVSRRHAQVEHGPDGFAIRDLDSTNGVFVNGIRILRQPLRDGDRIQVGTTTILKFCFQDDVEASFQRKLYDSATRDSLTGLYNRRFFVETLEVDFSYAVRNGTPLSLLLLDLDHFKGVNDTFGHMAGDSVLRETAELIQRGLRAEDVAARHGGEEFAVLLRYTEGSTAYAIAERIRGSIERHRFEHDGRVVRATISAGLATLEARSYDSWQALIEAADTFLYQAKQGGRNRTVYSGLDAPGRLTQTTVSLKTPEFRAPGPDESEEPEPQGGRPPRKASAAPPRGKRRGRGPAR